MKFFNCFESLAGVKVAEEMYLTDYGTYTTDKNLLGIYMIAGCTDEMGKASNCNGIVNSRIINNCEKGSEWTMTVGATGDLYSYYLKATANDRYQCKICVSPDGYMPESFKACIAKPPMKCPESEKKKRLAPETGEGVPEETTPEE